MCTHHIRKVNAVQLVCCDKRHDHLTSHLGLQSNRVADQWSDSHQSRISCNHGNMDANDHCATDINISIVTLPAVLVRSVALEQARLEFELTYCNIKHLTGVYLAKY